MRFVCVIMVLKAESSKKKENWKQKKNIMKM